MAYRGYHFFVDGLELPYAPSELSITIGSKNQTMELLDGNEINILKSPKLTEISFNIELPRGRQYPFANELRSSKTYLDRFEKLMKDKSPTRLVITRPNPLVKGQNFSSNKLTIKGDTRKDFESVDLTVSLEGYEIKESADNGFDVTVALKFKEYRPYGTVLQLFRPKKTTTSTQKTSTKTETKAVPIATKPVVKPKTYKVKKGDCLWKIAKAEYGTGTKWKTIYDANKTIIEATAKKYGKKSSSNGHWIYPGCELVIPKS